MGAAICPNCGTKYSCSCKLRTASDGTKCCSKCIQTYEQRKKATKPAVNLNVINVKTNG